MAEASAGFRVEKVSPSVNHAVAEVIGDRARNLSEPCALMVRFDP
jgi:hypothetical protein